MADDIFLTPEEQDERAKQWLKDNGLAIAVGIGLGLAGIFGYNQYQENLEIQAEQASGLYAAALSQINDSDISDIDTQVAELKENYSNTPYASKAVLLKARQVAVNDLPAALEELKWVVNNAPEGGLRHTARIRQAKIHVSLGELDEAKTLVTLSSYDGFESHYREILADVNARQGDFDAAREQYQLAISSLQSTDSGYAQILSLKMDRLPGATQDKAEILDPVEEAMIEKPEIEKTMAEEAETQ